MLVIALFSWLFLLVAIAIKVDDPEGLIIFKQLRVGKDGRTIRMWRFRSMHVDAEERLAALQALNEKDEPIFKIKDDPRITRVGRLIRKSSLDELLAPEEFSHIQSGDNRQSRSADSGQCAGSRLPNLCSGYTPLGCIPLTFVACGTASTE